MSEPSRHVRESDHEPDEAVRLYGHHAVAAALANPLRPCRRLAVTANAQARLGALAARPGLEVATGTPRDLDRLVGADAVHQGAVLEAGPLPERALEDVVPADPAPACVIVLDQILDPRNIGAILRTAAATGVAAAILPRHGSALLGGACAKAASGALDLVPLMTAANLGQALAGLKDRGFWLVGLDGAAAMPLEAAPTYPRCALVLGAEGKGLRRLTREGCDLVARLSIEPRIESLNVSVAAGIAMYFLARRLSPLNAAGAGHLAATGPSTTKAT